MRGVLFAACVALTACAPATASAPPTTPTATAATPTPARHDFTSPGEATRALAALIEAAGTVNAIKFDLREGEAVLSVVIGMSAKTYAWRAGRIEQVESDTQYVGQAIFDPRDFDLQDVAGLLAEAAQLSGSTSGQDLQIVEYNDGLVLMTVTTTPESQTVFFRRDGSPVARLDLTTRAGLRECLTDAIGERTAVLSLGILPGQGCYADTPGANSSTNRTLRSPNLPPRTSARNERPEAVPFDPRIIPANQLTDLVLLLAASRSVSPDEVGVTVARPEAGGSPQLRFTIAGTTLLTDLNGTPLPA